MRRWVLYIAILALVVAAPAKPVNIGDLLPIQAVAVYREDNRFRIETDTGDLGFGDTVSLALHSMRDTASGIIYLDTAEYLILTKDTLDAAEELRKELKPNVRLCMATNPLELTEVSGYLQVHGDLPKLKAWSKGSELPIISSFEKTENFSKKVEKRA